MLTKENRLSNQFFRKNPLKEISSATIAHYAIEMRLNEKLDQTISDIVSPDIDPKRKEKVLQERRHLEQLSNPAELTEFVRKGYDILNQHLLCTKILSQEEQVIPLLLKRYRTCALDLFIETTATILVHGKREYVQLLREMYDEIRSPYAQAKACLVFGMCEMENEIPFLLKEYQRFQREYPNESFDQHPLLSLYLLHGKY